MDHLKYLIKLNTQAFLTLMINIIFLSVSIILFLIDITTVTVVLLVFTLLDLIISLTQMSAEIRDFMQIRKCTIGEILFPYNKIEPSPKEKENNYVSIAIEKEQECAFYSKDINKNLRSNKIGIEISNKKYKKVIRGFKENLSNQLRFLAKNVRDSNKASELFTNYPKLCVSSDLTKENTAENGKIICHRGGYYDTYLSNIISSKRLIKDNNEELADGSMFSSYYRSYFVNEEGKNEWKFITKDIADSVNNNEIGISTLGFSYDKKFIIWKQKEKPQVSHNKLVPTGSGCCDYSDLKNNSLNDTIKSAMERELLEEGLKGDEIATERDEYIKDTVILGYYRWIKRGGKSEFVGLTKLTKERSLYEANGHEVVEAKELQEENHYIETIDDIPKFTQYVKNLENISIPLYMISIFLEDFYNSNREDLEKFLFSK